MSQRAQRTDQYIAQALTLLQPIWERLTTIERCELIGELIESIHYDGKAGELEINGKETGIHALLAA